MERRGLTITVLLILGVAMFASFYSEITGMQVGGGGGSSSGETSDLCDVFIGCYEAGGGESSSGIFPPGDFSGAIAAAEEECEKDTNAKERCETEIQGEVMECLKKHGGEICKVENYKIEEFGEDCETYHCAEVFENPNKEDEGLGGPVCFYSVKDGKIVKPGTCYPRSDPNKDVGVTCWANDGIFVGSADCVEGKEK